MTADPPGSLDLVVTSHLMQAELAAALAGQPADARALALRRHRAGLAAAERPRALPARGRARLRAQPAAPRLTMSGGALRRMAAPLCRVRHRHLPGARQDAGGQRLPAAARAAAAASSWSASPTQPPSAWRRSRRASSSSTWTRPTSACSPTRWRVTATRRSSCARAAATSRPGTANRRGSPHPARPGRADRHPRRRLRRRAAIDRREGPYEIIQGSLADLAAPAAAAERRRRPAAPRRRQSTRERPTATHALAALHGAGPLLRRLRRAARRRPHRERAASCRRSSDAEVLKTARSAWGYTSAARTWFGAGSTSVIAFDDGRRTARGRSRRLSSC